MMNVFGLSGLPVFQAGQASWQRPHSVQVKPSRRSFQPRSASVLQAERRVLGLEVHRRQLAARLELAEVDVEEARRDVEVLADGQVHRNADDEDDVRPPQDGEAGLERRVATGPSARSGTASAFATNAPGWSPYARDLERLGEELGGDEAADHAAGSAWRRGCR